MKANMYGCVPGWSRWGETWWRVWCWKEGLVLWETDQRLLWTICQCYATSADRSSWRRRAKLNGGEDWWNSAQNIYISIYIYIYININSMNDIWFGHVGYDLLKQTKITDRLQTRGYASTDTKLWAVFFLFSSLQVSALPWCNPPWSWQNHTTAPRWRLPLNHRGALEIIDTLFYGPQDVALRR